MDYTAEVKEYAIEHARKVLGGSKLVELIKKSQGGFEMSYKELDVVDIASGTSHYFRHGKPIKHRPFFEFLSDAIETAIQAGGGGWDYKLRFEQRRFTMDEKAVALFLRGLPYVCGQEQEQQAEPYVRSNQSMI